MSAKLAFTCGDPAGVGPEIIEAWLAAHRDEAGGVAVIGPARWLRALREAGADAQLVAAGAEDFAPVAGRPSVEGARVALDALERAAAGTRAGEFSGVVTGPVSKAWLQRAGYEFPGQTEFFAARWGGVPTMAFCGGKLRVVLLTWHIPLREVPLHLTPEELTRAVRAADELARAEGVAAPRIGVCGLNPHAGEGGMLGTEERDVIDPFLDSLRAGATASPPYPFSGGEKQALVLAPTAPDKSAQGRVRETLGNDEGKPCALKGRDNLPEVCGAPSGRGFPHDEYPGSRGLDPGLTCGTPLACKPRPSSLNRYSLPPQFTVHDSQFTVGAAAPSAGAGAGGLAGLSRCEPADTIFGRALRGEFDVVVALYHDQGLAPLKTIDFDEAVNVTLGLPFVRTSPDHGTAFGIAGRGVASARSFANAVDVARRLIAARAAG